MSREVFPPTFMNLLSGGDDRVWKPDEAILQGHSAYALPLPHNEL